MNFEILVSFIIATSTLAFSPGPDNIYVMMQSIVHGKKYGIATVGGLITGCLVHTTFVAFGMSIIIKEQLWLFTIIKWCGAIYLIYLAYKVYKSSSNLVLNNNNIPRKTMSQ